MTTISNADALFYSQLAISITGLVFTGAMLVAQPNNINIYLPIFTSLIFSWVPSPLSNKNIQNQIDGLNGKVQLINTRIESV